MASCRSRFGRIIGRTRSRSVAAYGSTSFKTETRNTVIKFSLFK